MDDTKIVTFMNYRNLFEHVEKSGLILPNSFLDSDVNIDSIIHDLINELDTTEAISYSSFLNALVQVYSAEDTQKYGWAELRACKLTRIQKNEGIIFHRDNLLHAIGMLIEKESPGSNKITGQETFENAGKYYKALLLISDKRVFHPSSDMAEQILLKDNILRAFPYYYFPKIVENIYRVRLQRYWYIYNDLLDEMEANEGSKIGEGLEKIMGAYGITLNEYFYGMIGIFSWFLQTQQMKDSDPTNEAAKRLGFNHKNTESFYVRRQNFGDDNPTFNIIERLSKDLTELKINIAIPRRDKLQGFYKNFQCFFDSPIFRIDQDNFCIIDLKFLLEGICSGFIWKINEIDPSNFLSIREQYGHLIELYFTNLVTKIFGEEQIRVNLGEGEPDAILETDEFIIIFEFTVEHYRLASLYSETTEKFIEDIYKVLFNKGREDELSRNKKDKGKFFKLNSYVEKYKNKGKTIIPVLITENNLGDTDLLNSFGEIITKKIDENNLSGLKENVPLIIHLDDLEFFWKISNSKDAATQFIKFINNWRGHPKHGVYHFSFSYFMSDSHDAEKIDNDFGTFFNWAEFTKAIKNSPLSS